MYTKTQGKVTKGTKKNLIKDAKKNFNQKRIEELK
jgi:hypothetical protein